MLGGGGEGGLRVGVAVCAAFNGVGKRAAFSQWVLGLKVLRLWEIGLCLERGFGIWLEGLLHIN